MLDVYVSRNNFENRKKEFIFRSRNCGTITRDKFVQMIAESNTTVTETDTIAVMTLIEQQFDKLINEGFAVQLPMGTFRAGASGTAESPDDRFCPKPARSPDTPKRDHALSLLFEPDRKKEKNLRYHVKYQKVKSRTVCRPFFDGLYTIDNPC
ncbi:MAG: DNA-binding domain-containing protein, partial [Treponema sp.]